MTVSTGLITPLNVPTSDQQSIRVLSASQALPQGDALSVKLGESTILTVNELLVGDPANPAPAGNPVAASPGQDVSTLSLNLGPVADAQGVAIYPGAIQSGLESAVTATLANIQGGISLERLVGANTEIGNYFALTGVGDTYNAGDHPAAFVYTNRENLLTTSTSEDGPTLTVVGEKGDLPGEPNYPVEVGLFNVALVSTDRVSLIQLDGNLGSAQDLPTKGQDVAIALTTPGEVISASPTDGVSIDLTNLHLRDVGVGQINVLPSGMDTFQMMATEAPKTDSLINTYAPLYVGATDQSQAPTVQEIATGTVTHLIGGSMAPELPGMPDLSGLTTPPMAPMAPQVPTEMLTPITSPLTSLVAPLVPGGAMLPPLPL